MISDHNLKSIPMYPDHIKPVCVSSQLHWHQSSWLMGRVSTAGEGLHELLVVVTGVVSVQPEVGPLHEDVGDILASRLVKDGLLESLALMTFHIYFDDDYI